MNWIDFKTEDHYFNMPDETEAMKNHLWLVPGNEPVRLFGRPTSQPAFEIPLRSPGPHVAYRGEAPGLGPVTIRFASRELRFVLPTLAGPKRVCLVIWALERDLDRPSVASWARKMLLDLVFEYEEERAR